MTDKERKAIEMALEALLDAQDAIANEFSIVDAYADEIEAIRQALNVDAIDISATCVDETEKREHEPVAWYYADSDVEIHSVALSEDLDDDQKANCIPLYTAPPSKPWVSLTSEELASIVVKHAGYPTRQLAAIEAKLKEKNT